MRMKALLGGVGIAALLLMGSSVVSSTPAQAQRWEDCRDRIDHAQARLDRAIDRFGRHSEQARDARHDLERTRDWCERNHRDQWDQGWRGHDRRDHGHDHY